MLVLLVRIKSVINMLHVAYNTCNYVSNLSLEINAESEEMTDVSVCDHLALCRPESDHLILHCEHTKPQMLRS